VIFLKLFNAVHLFMQRVSISYIAMQSAVIAMTDMFVRLSVRPSVRTASRSGIVSKCIKTTHANIIN